MPELCVIIVPPQTEGAGKAGRAMHPQPRVRMKKAHEHSHYRYAETIRLSLRDGFTTYSALSPAIGLFVAVAGPMRTHRHQLRASVEALRPHGFVVRALVHSSSAPCASTASRFLRP